LEIAIACAKQDGNVRGSEVRSYQIEVSNLVEVRVLMETRSLPGAIEFSVAKLAAAHICQDRNPIPIRASNREIDSSVIVPVP
jgi:hypothetical protein